MDEGLTSDQTALARAMSHLLEREGHLAITRRFCQGDMQAAQALAQDFHDIGGHSILVPEAWGGSGLGTVEAALLARTVGRACSPVPYLGAMIASRALALTGCPQAQSMWLETMATGNRRIAASLRQADARHGGDGRGHGQVSFVVDGPGCDALLIRDEDGALRLVPASAGLAWTELLTIDRSRRFGDVRIGRLADPTRLAATPQQLQELVALERVLVAAENLGACEALLARALAHAQSRHQFGRPIGAFQAVKHLCADMAAELDLARSLVWHAATRHATGDSGSALLCTKAKAQMDEVARVVARGAIELHGAMGFAEQSDLHLWTKRIAVNRTVAGTPEQLRREVAIHHGWVV